MIKPDKNFKLSKRAKTIIALTCKTDTDRNDLCAMLVQAELAGEAARRQSLKSKGNKTRDAE